MLGVMRFLKHAILVAAGAWLLAACSLTHSTSASSTQEATASSTPTATVSSSMPPPSGSSSSASDATTATASGPATDVRKVTDAAAFATPSGRIVCVMADNSARCDYIAGDKAWTSPEPKACHLAWGDSLQLTQTAGSTCHGDTLADTPSLDSGYEGWRRSGDPTVVVNGLTLAALPYGSGLLVGALECDSATTGVTCRNTGTGHGFTMSREAYSIF